jgi:hypothetical protein
MPAMKIATSVLVCAVAAYRRGLLGRGCPYARNYFPLWDGVCQEALGIISISSVRLLDARCFLWDFSETPSRAGKMQTEALPRFSLDSRNENLPEKRIHRNYALTAVPMSSRSRIADKVSVHCLPQ